MNLYYTVIAAAIFASCTRVSTNKNTINEKQDDIEYSRDLIKQDFDCDSFLKSYPFQSEKEFDLSLYRKIYAVDLQCAKKFISLYYSHHPEKPTIDTTTNCDMIKTINLSQFNKSEIISIYSELLLSKNDNCPLELLDELKGYESSKKDLIDTLSYHVDGYVAEYYCELFPSRCEGIQPKRRN